MESEPGVPETPAVPAELKEGLPRRTRLTGHGFIPVITATVLLVLGGVWGYQLRSNTVRLRQQETALRRSASEATGEIKRVWVPGGSSVSWVSYDFAVNGANFKGEARVPGQLLQDVRNSYTLPVRYLPGNPAVNHPAAWKGSPRWNWETMLIPVILAVAVGLGMLLMQRKLRQLIAEGTPVLAVVTKCSRSNSSGGFLVKYEFHLGDGKVIKGAGWCKNQQEIGANIWVLYLPQNPQLSRPYPMLNFRLARP